MPREADYASVFHSDMAIVVQQARLDSRRPARALPGTVAFCQPGD